MTVDTADNNSRRIFWSLFLAVFSAMIGVGVITPFLPLLGQKFGASATELGILVSAFSVSRLFGMPVAGRLADRYGRKRFIFAGLAGYTLLSFAYLASSSVWEFTVVRLLHGLAAALVVPLAMAVVADLAQPGKEGTQIGTFTVSIGAGWGLGPLMGGILLDRFGFSAAFYFMGALTGLALLLAVLFLPRTPSPVRDKPPVPYLEMLRHRQVRALTWYRISSVTGRSLLIAFLPLYAITRIHLTPTETGIIISAMVLLMSALQPVFGRLADRTSRKNLMAASSVLGAATLAIVPLSGSFWPLLVSVIAFGFANELGSVSATALVVVEGREFGMGSTIALFSTALSAGMIVGPLIGGIGEDWLGPGASFWSASAVVLTGVLVSRHISDAPPLEAGLPAPIPTPVNQPEQ